MISKIIKFKNVILCCLFMAVATMAYPEGNKTTISRCAGYGSASVLASFLWYKAYSKELSKVCSTGKLKFIRGILGQTFSADGCGDVFKKYPWTTAAILFTCGTLAVGAVDGILEICRFVESLEINSLESKINQKEKLIEHYEREEQRLDGEIAKYSGCGNYEDLDFFLLKMKKDGTSELRQHEIYELHQLKIKLAEREAKSNPTDVQKKLDILKKHREIINDQRLDLQVRSDEGLGFVEKGAKLAEECPSGAYEINRFVRSKILDRIRKATSMDELLYIRSILSETNFDVPKRVLQLSIDKRVEAGEDPGQVNFISTLLNSFVQ